MSSVSPSSDAPNYYYRDINRLEEDIHSEAEKNRNRSDQKIAELEERYARALAKKDTENQETINELRNASEQSLNKERDKFKDAINEQKYESYNKRGILKTEDQRTNDEYRKIINSQDLSHQEELKKKEDHLKFDLQAQDENYKNNLRKTEENTNQTVENIRRSSAEASAKDREASLDQIDQLKTQLYNAKGEAVHTVPYETYKQELQSALDAANKRHEADEENNNQTRLKHTDNLKNLTDKHDFQIADLTKRQAAELKSANNEIQDLTSYNDTVVKKHSEDLADTIRNESAQRRREIDHLQQDFELKNAKIKDEMGEREQILSNRNNEILKNKEQYLSRVIANQNAENYRGIKDLQNEFNRQREENTLTRQTEKMRNDKQTEFLVNKGSDEKSKALQDQAAQFQQTLGSQDKNNKEQVQQLQQALHEQKTTEDFATVSPWIEAKLRNRLVEDYNKTLDAETDKNKVATDHLRQTYYDKYNEAIQDFRNKETKNHEDKNRELIFQKNRFLDSVSEAGFQSDARMRHQVQDQEKERDSLFRQFNNVVDRQKQDYEELLSNFQVSSENKYMDLLQRSDSELRTALRTANGKQTDLIRDYEKKLSDQKTEYEFELENQKVEFQSEVRNLDRKSKSDLEAMSKSYEQRIAQLDAQNKERERSVAQTYQDDLDRTRRSYELLSKKKS